uniref:RNA polymerase II subunit B1 CTD phosphatase RPAP2 homolog n=1 Tax=Eptatretus burgeri TaxID=7764 RepID=A0A8C4WVW8_EPTBU
MKLAVRKRVEAERVAHQAVVRLLEDDVTQEVLAQLGGKITPAHYDDVIEERALEMLCGFPLCNKHLKYVAKQQFKIVMKTNKVYDLSRRKRFCSNFCFGASRYFASQIPSGPLGMREGEMYVLHVTSRALFPSFPGDLIHFTLAQDLSVSCSHPSSHSNSSSPSSSDEDAFVSSIVGRDHKHHFAHPSEATVEEEREKFREQTNSRGGREWNSNRNIKGSNERDIMKDVESKTRLEMNGDNYEDAAVVSRASDLLRNSDPSSIHPENTKPGRYLAATNQTASCLDTRLMLQVSQMTLAPDPEIRQPLTGDPVMKQDVAPDLSSKDHSLLDNNVSLPQTISPNAGSRDASPLAPCISSYGISASGAAALRKLLVHHRSAKGAEWHVPDAVRKPVNQGSIAEKIAATLRSWRTEEAVEFLRCDGTTSSLKPSDHPEDAVHGKVRLGILLSGES